MSVPSKSLLEIYVSPEEHAAIMEMRRKSDAIKEHSRLSMEILTTAHRYEQWLRDNGAGSSYSTFCNEFGYQGERSSFIYAQVQRIRHVAKDFEISNTSGEVRR